MPTKILLTGNEGNGKSRSGNLILHKDSFICSNSVDRVTEEISSDSNGEITVIDCPGFGNRDGRDEETVVSIVDKMKREKVNAIFLVFNATQDRVDRQTKEFISLICKMFIGKYVWKNIGIIFTRCGNNRDPATKQDFVNRILEIAQQQYDEITRTQTNENRTQDQNERLVNTLPCYFVEAVKVNGHYDEETLRQRNLIIEKARNCNPITQVASKILLRDVFQKDLVKVKEEIIRKNITFWGDLIRGAAHVFLAPAMPVAALGGSETLDDYFKAHDEVSRDVGYKRAKKITTITYDKKTSYYAGRQPEIEEFVKNTKVDVYIL